VQFFLGNIALKETQLDTAMQHFQKALSFNPNYLAARTALAATLLDKGSIADSRIELNKVLSVNKDFVPARLVDIAISRTEKKYAEAEQQANALAKEQPTNPDVYAQLALNDMARGRTADAEKNLVRALELQPDSFERLAQLVGYYVETKQLDKAV